MMPIESVLNIDSLPAWVIAIAMAFQWGVKPLFMWLTSQSSNTGKALDALSSSDKEGDKTVKRLIEVIATSSQEQVLASKVTNRVLNGMGKILQSVTKQLIDIKEDTQATRVGVSTIDRDMRVRQEKIYRDLHRVEAKVNRIGQLLYKLSESKEDKIA